MINSTSVQIPCCLCGTLILPNAANQCSSCLAQNFDLQSKLQQGPSNAECSTIYQCRKCRRFQRTEKRFDHCEMESPELLALCLKQIPALQHSASHGHAKIQLVDAAFVWTEPHSMRLKLHLTVRTIIHSVTLQQRCQIWLKIQFKMCPDCNREYTSRTWQALVQVRQKRQDTNTLALLEMALAKKHDLRSHVLQMTGVQQGFDFYFLALNQAQAFCSGLQRILPMQLSIHRKMVSEDNHSNTANMKYTLRLNLVPLCRHDLILVGKKCATSLAGRLALVHRLGAGAIHLLDAHPTNTAMHHHHHRNNIKQTGELTEEAISQEAYYKQEKQFHVLHSARQMTKFVVLDVELWNQEEERKRRDGIDESPLAQMDGAAYNNKFALADVQVVRQDGSGDDVLTTVTHLGRLLQPGDIVLGYDLSQSMTMQQDDLLQESLNSNVVVPDIVLVKKIQGTAAVAGEEALQQDGEELGGGLKPKMSKAKQRRRRRAQGKKSVELEESAIRMGLLEAPGSGDDFEQALDDDSELAEELLALERDLDGLELGSAEPNDKDGDDVEENGVVDGQEENIVEDEVACHTPAESEV